MALIVPSQGAGASVNAPYITIALEDGLTAERKLTAGSGISIVDGGANGNLTISNTSPGVTVFTGLSDTPSSYTGDGTKVVRVNAGETGLEFVTAVGNTLDQAYDQGGAGAGRTITADSGAVVIDGAGGLLVGTTANPSSRFVLLNQNVAGNIEFEFKNSNTSSSSQVIFYVTANAVEALMIARESDNFVQYASLGQSRFGIGPIGGTPTDIEFFGGVAGTVARMAPAGNWRCPDGTALLPAYSFLSDTNIGMFRVGTDIIGWSTAGVLRFSLLATGEIQGNAGLTVEGGALTGNDLTLSSTANATKGKILFGTSAYDEVNNRLGIGTDTPNARMDVRGVAGAVVGGFASGSLHVTSSSALANANAVITGHNLNGGNKQLWYLGSVSSSNDNIAFINRQIGSLSLQTSNSLVTLLSGSSNTLQGNAGMTLQGGSGVHTLTLSGGASAASSISIGIGSEKIGFFGGSPVVKPTGVGVTTSQIHAALVTLGLIEA